MFTVYHSNQIDILKSILVELIKANPLENPFDKELILVQSPGMSQWLKIELAKELGIAANIDFPLPATFIWNMFIQVLDDVPERSAFNKESMTWKLMRVIPGLLDTDEFAPLKQYLESDTDGSMLYQLSGKVADIFDGYLVYRPEWIAQWEAGKSVSVLNQEQPWQPILWQALYDYTLSLEQSPYHRANLYENFIDTLDSYVHKFEALPDRIFVFGISSLPPRYLDALKALGKHTDVHLMFTNPSRYYWGEIRDRNYLAKLANQQRRQLEWQKDHYEPKGHSSVLKGSVEQNIPDVFHTDVAGNSLLASMGKLGRDNLYLLSQLESNEIEAFVDLERDSLLHQIQADILNLEQRQDDERVDSSTHKYPVSKDDTSLILHTCHSPMREVEVLHDNLLAMFDETPELKPRDIIVMVADINVYSPAIQSVFGNAQGERFIPYSISDRSSAEENPVLVAFMTLMALPDSRCSVSELLELLETPELMKRFDISEAEFGKAALWIEESGIRWGIDSDTAADFDLPAPEQNHWLFGIQRMMLGYAMAGEDNLFKHGEQWIAPYNEVQGLDASLAGKLAHFISTVRHYRDQFSKDHIIDDWKKLIYELLEDFFTVELDGEISLKLIRDTISRLESELEDAKYDQEITPTVIRLYLEEKLSGSRVSQRFLSGQVNFCTLMPMRSIPFKVVCLLGMNDGAYPRSVPKDGFDLMNVRLMPGDRSRRDDDRYLFLEALISAGENLYISYVGRSIQDNTERAPSILVTELMEYCAENFCMSGDEALHSDQSAENLKNWIEHIHPMVPFSELAFDKPKPSYAREWLPVVNNKGTMRKPFIQPLQDIQTDSELFNELPLAELQRFWRLPVQYFFNRRLKVTFDYAVSSPEDEEPFKLDGLQSYHMRDELLEVLLASRLNSNDESKETECFIRRYKARGALPVGAFGDLEFEAGSELASLLTDELEYYCQAPMDDVEVSLQFELPGYEKTLLITGWLKSQYQSGMVRYRSGKIRSQDWLSAWIDHLFLCSSDIAKPTHIIGYDRSIKVDPLQHKVLLPLDVETARAHLQLLINLFIEGMNQPLTYFPRSALAGAEQILRGKDDAGDKMKSAFNDGYFVSGEGSNSYIRRVWPEWNKKIEDQLLSITQDVLVPVLRHSEDIEAYKN